MDKSSEEIKCVRIEENNKNQKPIMDNDKRNLLQASISMKDSIKDLISIENHNLTVAQQCLTTRVLEKLIVGVIQNYWLKENSQ